jgi:3-methyladenine DNA glycosylase AlkD
MQYFLALQIEFEKNADPLRAASVRSYMKDIADFYGMSAPIRQTLSREFFKQYGYPQKQYLEAIVHYAWEKPEREWQYVAMDIIEHYAKKGEEVVLPLAAYMITHKSWWDTVDFIASNIVGALLKKRPDLIPSQIEEWMQSENLWLQRSCLLFQLKYRKETDEELLFGLCERLSKHKNFFIRKAIGWSLREYSKHNPKAVLEFVQTHELSPLSSKEAIRWMVK